jgi:hypothetical protein
MFKRTLSVAIGLLWISAALGADLREDTATQVAIGPFLDGTDGVTAETALTVTDWDCDLVKHANSSMAITALTITASGGSNDAAHLTSGMYSLELTATDTNTAGRLVLICDHATPTTFMAVRHEWEVKATTQWDLEHGVTTFPFPTAAPGASGGLPTLDANLNVQADIEAIDDDTTSAANLEAYTDGTTPIPANAIQFSADAAAADNAELFFDGTGYAGGTIKLGVDAVAFSGDTGAADALELAYDGTAGTVAVHGIIDQGTANTGSAADTFVLRAGQSLADRANAGWTVYLASGTGAGQSRLCGAFTTADDTCTIAPDWDTTPDNTSVYKIYATPPGTAGSLTAAAIVDEFESQSTADPTGFRVNVMEVGGVAQTARDLGGEIDAVESDIDTLLARLTSARADYLDNLSGGAVALQGSVDELETRLTAARALLLDELDGATPGTAVADINTILAFLDALEDGSGTFLGCTFTIDPAPGTGEFYINIASCVAP